MAQESHRAGLPALWGAVRLFDGFLKIRFEFHMVENTAFIAEANVSLWGICCTEEESVAPPEPVLKEMREQFFGPPAFPGGGPEKASPAALMKPRRYSRKEWHGYMA